ncbi:MAG: hypothetical protein IJI57_03435 [Flexilinea sp.]|nr:hypothetical protein [Flexilinea sp.]
MGRSLAFFGAFNPPTRAHIDLAEYAMRDVGAEDVIFVPSKAIYITEEQKKGFAFSDADRIRMLAQIASYRSWMRYTDIEMQQSVQPKTYKTLCMLREAGEDPTLLLGADKLPELDHLWQYIPEIASEFGIVCMDRADLDCDTLIRKSPFLSSLNIRVVHVPDSYKDFSSSRVRDCLFHLRGLKDELTALLPPELGNLPSDLLKNQGNNNENLC